jgi:uncharacterized protein YggE
MVVAMAALWAMLGGVASAQEPVTLAAAGDGNVLLRPDQARLYVSVDRVRSTSRAARADTNRQVARLLRALRAHGVAKADVQTAGVTVSRERLHRRGHRPRVRYRAATELDVRSSDIPHLGALIDALSEAGADDVSGPDFGFSDPSRGTIRATRAALADARRRADDAAGQLGLRITGIASVDLSPGPTGFEGASGSAGAGAGGGATRILPGRQEFSATVRVVYTVAPA